MKEIKHPHHIRLTGSLFHPILQLWRYETKILQFPGMASWTDMRIEHGSVVMDAEVHRNTYFLYHVCTDTVCLVMNKDGFCIHRNYITHKNSNFLFFARQWVRQRRTICDITEFAVIISV